ncbi:MAG: hypothetical protein IJO06_10240 [Thermoguttaceae bacterium]|nr:hypothetical protein [Thermoguttaceae bacterium]
MTSQEKKNENGRDGKRASALRIAAATLCLGAAAVVAARQATFYIESQIAGGVVAREDASSKIPNRTAEETREIRRLAAEFRNAMERNDWPQALAVGRVIVADYPSEPELEQARRGYVEALILTGAWDEAERAGRDFYAGCFKGDAAKAEKTWLESQERIAVLYGQGRRREAFETACSRLKKVGIVATEEGRLDLAERLAVASARPRNRWTPTLAGARERADLDAATEFVAFLEATFDELGKPEANAAEVVVFQKVLKRLKERVEAREEATRRRAEAAVERQEVVRKRSERIVLEPETAGRYFGSTFSGAPTLGSKGCFNALSQGRYDETIGEIVDKIESATFWRDEYERPKNGVYTGANRFPFEKAEDFKDDVASLAIACELSGRFDRAEGYYRIALTDSEEKRWTSIRLECARGNDQYAARRVVDLWESGGFPVSYDALERLVERAKAQNVVEPGFPVYVEESREYDEDWRKCDRLKTYAALVVCPELFFAIKSETKEDADARALELRREKFAEFLAIFEAAAEKFPARSEIKPGETLDANPMTKERAEPTLRYFRKLAELP